jgi:TusA-related sulfurtransferase
VKNEIKEKMDTKGLEWQQATFKIAAKFMQMQPGPLLEITGNHPRFEGDIKTWCRKLNKPVIFVNRETSNLLICQIQF